MSKMGFSKFTKEEKIETVIGAFGADKELAKETLMSFWHSDDELQKLFDDFSENSITNFFLPYGILPNVLINGESYNVPMVIEESSVVAAASKSAKFWKERGGFKTTILGTKKFGQVHFTWKGDAQKLVDFFEYNKLSLIREVSPLMSNMIARGGGLLDILLKPREDIEDNFYQVWATFDTCDSMGANLINSVLESLGQHLSRMVASNESFSDEERELHIVMAILSNYTPDCLVRAEVRCKVEELGDFGNGIGAELFAKKFCAAVKIARNDIYRATTHNKGIFNGIDAVVLATGNDFRAVEACGHAYASRDGQYRSLSQAEVKEGAFRFWLDIPMAIGTVGGLTTLHPLAKISLDLLGRPNAAKLMEIVATVGLAQNFAAIRSLVTTGIQKGHMRMHLMNILNQLQANEDECVQAKDFFTDKVVSFKGVRDFLEKIRIYH